MPTLFEQPVVGFARVAVERGIDRYPDGLTYGIPPALETLAPGERVVVPLGRGNARTAGYVIEVGRDIDLGSGEVKLIERRDGTAAPLPRGLLDLARWVAGYYCAPIGLTLAAMLPAAVRRNVGAVSRIFVDLPEAPDAPDATPVTDVRLSPAQRAVLDALAALAPAERPVEIRSLAAAAGVASTAPIRRLLARGLLRSLSRTSIEADWSARAADAPVPARLTGDQEGAVAGIAARLGDGFSAHLLFGVTGSGKTEVYVRLIERAVAAGRTALVLVPEIALTPQTGGRLIARFPNQRVAVLHSGLTAAQRNQQWSLVAEGAARIVLGARSAVFAPIPEGALGLVVVDEEHDGSYKQDQAPRYHGRDVAVRRAQLAGCPIVLGSATPSLESWHNATVRGAYALHRLRERAPGLQVPRVRVVDLAAERRARHDRRVHLLGPVLEQAIEDALRRGGQVLLLLNRRGYANYIACADAGCGWAMRCDHCDVTLVYHRDRTLPAGGFVQCHHCRSEQKLPAACPDCGKRITTFGLGTQRVEEELVRKFPRLEGGRRLRRVDADAMRSARDLHDVLDRFGAGEILMLVGTQMIGKGLDYPGVRVVGVINADTSLHLPDFRAAERTFQLVAQVAGRCGRSAEPGSAGLVVVQTFDPRAAAIRLAAAHDYEGFAAAELAERGRCGLPPAARLTRIVVRHREHERCETMARALAAALSGIAPGGVMVHGPAPCPIGRIAGRHRWQVEVRAGSAREMQAFLSEARNRSILRPGEATAVDVDPVALL